jgi:glutathione S-transferase
MAAMTLVVGNKTYSSWSLRAWLALKRTGEPFAEILVPLDQPDTRARILEHSPSGKVPHLTHGAIRVWESLAICEYLAEAFPAARLWPADPAVRAQARAVSTEMHGGFAELRRNMPMDLSHSWPQRNRARHCEADIARVAEIWRDCRERFGKPGAHGSGDFLFGSFSIADAMYAPVTTRFTTYGHKLDAGSMRYVEAVAAWPAMREWVAAAKQEPWELTYEVFNQAP